MPSTAFEIPNRIGLPLRGDVRCPDLGARLPVVVICHGFKGFKDWGFFPYVAERLSQAGFLAVSFNFSGAGVGADLQNFTELDRFATDTISAQVDDLGCVLDAVTDGSIGSGRADLQRIALLGHSRGGGIAILRAHEDRRVRAVVTWAGISNVDRWTPAEAREWRQRGFVEVVNTRTGQVFHMNVTFPGRRGAQRSSLRHLESDRRARSTASRRARRERRLGTRTRGARAVCSGTARSRRAADDRRQRAHFRSGASLEGHHSSIGTRSRPQHHLAARQPGGAHEGSTSQ
jgi:dienelactone hydrolase